MNWLQNVFAELAGYRRQIQLRDTMITGLQGTIDSLKEALKVANTTISELQEPDTFTPPEKLVQILAGIEPSAEAWYELASIISDYMKVRAVQTITVSAVEINARLRILFPVATMHRMRDDTYFLPTKAKAFEIVQRDWSNLLSYIAQQRDCDKFSTIFKAHLSLHYGLNCAVEAWSQTHSFILLLCSDGEVLLEPQTDLTFKVADIPSQTYFVNEVFA